MTEEELKAIEASAWIDKGPTKAKKVNRLRNTIRHVLKFGVLSVRHQRLCEAALRATDDRRNR